MNKRHVLLVMLACLLACGLAFFACDNGGGGGGGSLGETLELSGQVYTEDWGDDGFETTYKEYSGNLTVTSPSGGSGSITDGKLSFTIETPTYLSSVSSFEGDLEDEGYTNVTISPSNAQFAELRLNGGSYQRLRKENEKMSMSSSSISFTNESVTYYYVDKDVTISGKGGTFNDDGFNITVQNLSLNLKQGWNAVYVKETGSMNFMTETGSGNVSVSLSNPSLRWVLD